MASIVANLPSPPLLVHGRRTLFSTLQRLSLSPIKEPVYVHYRHFRVEVLKVEYVELVHFEIIDRLFSEMIYGGLEARNCQFLSEEKTMDDAFCVCERERQNCVFFFVRATGENSAASTPLRIVKSVKNRVSFHLPLRLALRFCSHHCQGLWDDPEDRLALVGLGFAALVAIWISAKLIPAIDKLPVVPSALELIGILFSSGRAIPDHQQVSCQYLRPVKCSQACTLGASLIGISCIYLGIPCSFSGTHLFSLFNILDVHNKTAEMKNISAHSTECGYGI
ncbi:hypothetical protein SADUNF_Sadunf03G0027800 [Salix dunnii]|uniref:Cyanobacterial aminoacyl-tRNA synthetase CAAD domain-containing protein n=1 Tax=Salix dunnii TaxID=1413687 RepID=A0A835KD29_9ROSI|nr:hypothetical protein SADUNF_Sadunf03G0027800 [Salix dunnii]